MGERRETEEMGITKMASGCNDGEGVQKKGRVSRNKGE